MSLGFNRVLLMGAVENPRFKWTSAKYAVLEFQLACERSYRTADGKDRTDVTRVPVIAFAGTAERCQSVLHGTEMVVEGRFKQEQYKGGPNGEMRTSLVVVADRCDYTGAPGAPPGPDPRREARSAPVPASELVGAA
jgi:single-stranded DNA-binding protein